MTDEATDGIAGVRFGNAGKLFYVDAVGMRLDQGDYVVVQTSRGPRLARIVIGTEQVVVNEMNDDDLWPVLRLATEQDIERAHDLRDEAKEVLPEARGLAEQAGLSIHLDHADYTLDGGTLMVAFSTEHKEDTRRFASELSNRYGARVDLYQVGARDRARMAGGYGICGRELCCASWLSTFPSISIRMAKNQEKPLNPQKISGLCGRLLCCLSYEDEGYKEMRKTLPRVGQRCSTPTGEGKVVALNVLKREVTLLVGGQRVVATDRDLGTVIRWDPRARDAEPPQSTAPEAEETGEESEAVAAAAPEPEATPELETGEPPEQSQPSRGRGRRRGGGSQRPSQPQQDQEDAPRRVRRFQRKGEPGESAPAEEPPTASNADTGGGQEGGSSRRRRNRGRRGRGKRGGRSDQ